MIRLKDDDSNGIISTYKFDYDENHEFDQYIETTLTWRQTNEIKADREHYTYVARENFDFFSESSDRYFIHLRILCIEIAPGKYIHNAFLSKSRFRVFLDENVVTGTFSCHAVFCRSSPKCDATISSNAAEISLKDRFRSSESTLILFPPMVTERNGSVSSVVLA